MKEKLLKKISERNLTVGVVGLGYVGLPLAVEKAKAGFKTIGFDVQKEKVDLVNKGQNYIGDVVDSDLKKLVEAGAFSATTDFSFVKDVDFIAICVPTPLDRHQQPDISYVRDSAKEISKYLKKETMVVLESTTYPGTTEELIKPIIENGSGLKCGYVFRLSVSISQSFVPFPRHTGSTPSASGSSVPVWPIFFCFNIPRSFATTSWDV